MMARSLFLFGSGGRDDAAGIGFAAARGFQALGDQEGQLERLTGVERGV
jgi:hypothetical protein